MLTNYKINQPFTSDCSVEEGEKNSSRTWNHGAGRIVNHVETFFYTEARKVSGRKTIQSQHCESQFVPGWTWFFLVPFKESRFIIRDKYSAGKRSSRSGHHWKILRDRDWFLLQSTSVQFLAKTLKSSMQQISWVWMLQKVFQIWHVLTPFSTSEREAVKTNARWNPVTFSSKQQQASWSTLFIYLFIYLYTVKKFIRYNKFQKMSRNPKI